MLIHTGHDTRPSSSIRQLALFLAWLPSPYSASRLCCFPLLPPAMPLGEGVALGDKNLYCMNEPPVNSQDAVAVCVCFNDQCVFLRYMIFVFLNSILTLTDFLVLS